MNAKNENAVIFIDGNNFYHNMHEIQLSAGIDFDYEAFSRKLVGTRQWVETRYYIGRVQQKGDLTRYRMQRKFIAHLERFNQINVFLGRLEMRPAKDSNKKLQNWLNALPRRDDMDLPSNAVDELTSIAQAVSAPIWIEKAVDVMLATDMVSMAYEGQYDVAYLVSADGDFTPAVKKVRAIGRKVFAASPQYGAKLAGVVNTFIPMDREFFHGCWL